MVRKFSFLLCFFAKIRHKSTYVCVREQKLTIYFFLTVFFFRLCLFHTSTHSLAFDQTISFLQTVYAVPDPEDGVMLYFPIVNRWQGGTGTIKYTLIRHKKSIFMGYDTGKLLDHNGNEIECYRSQPPPFRIANAIIL